MSSNNQNWMMRIKLDTLYIILNRNFSEEGDFQLAEQIIRDIEELVETRKVNIREKLREKGKIWIEYARDAIKRIKESKQGTL